MKDKISAGPLPYDEDLDNIVGLKLRHIIRLLLEVDPQFRMHAAWALDILHGRSFEGCFDSFKMVMGYLPM